jgi:7,8-dihydroneopterin aldolase/epimerase/oxygenase
VSYNEIVTPLKPAGSKHPPRLVFVRDLVLDAEIGVHAHEKGHHQRIRVNVDIRVDDEGGPLHDQLQNVVCYENIVDGIKALLKNGHVNLVESLAEAIADFILKDPRVINAKIGVEKLDAVPEALSVGVEIERNRES